MLSKWRILQLSAKTARKENLMVGRKELDSDPAVWAGIHRTEYLALKPYSVRLMRLWKKRAVCFGGGKRAVGVTVPSTKI
jgi:hypothetical protein